MCLYAMIPSAPTTKVSARHRRPSRSPPGHRDRPGSRIGVAHRVQPSRRVFGRVLVVQAVDRHGLLARQPHQQRMFVPAGDAPGREHVDERHVPRRSAFDRPSVGPEPAAGKTGAAFRSSPTKSGSGHAEPHREQCGQSAKATAGARTGACAASHLRRPGARVVVASLCIRRSFMFAPPVSLLRDKSVA